MKILKTANYIKIAVRIDNKTKNQVAIDFAKVGLDGNGRFEEPHSGISPINGILARYAISISDVTSRDLFLGPRGNRTFNLEKKSLAQANDAFMPGDEIKNSMLVYTWQQMPSNTCRNCGFSTREDETICPTCGEAKKDFEILAYLS